MYISYIVLIPFMLSEAIGTSTTRTTEIVFNNCTLHTTCTEDGYFKEGVCVSTFCQCWDGEGTVDVCREPLKFDETISACNWPNQIDECMSTEASTPITNSSSTTSPEIDCNDLCADQNTGDSISNGCCAAQY